MSKELQYYKFEKDPDNRWYIILPEWTGDRAELEMVMGADTMLDIIAQGENLIEICLSLEKYENFTYELSYVEDMAGGALYRLKSDLYEFDVWLCHVTYFVFGFLPDKIYIK